MKKVLIEGMATDADASEDKILDDMENDLEGTLEMVKVYDGEAGKLKKFRVEISVKEIAE